MSFAQIIPDIITAYILPPGKVEALAKYKPVIGVLKYGFLTSIDWSKEYEAPSGIDVYHFMGCTLWYITINLLHQLFTKDHHISLQSIKREAITMLKVVILAMCFKGDITSVISELKAKASLKKFTGF